MLMVRDSFLEPEPRQCVRPTLAGSGQRVIDKAITGKQIRIPGAMPVSAVRGIDEITRPMRARPGRRLIHRAGRCIEHRRHTMTTTAPHLRQRMPRPVRQRVQRVLGQPSSFRCGQNRNFCHQSTITFEGLSSKTQMAERRDDRPRYRFAILSGVCPLARARRIPADLMANPSTPSGFREIRSNRDVHRAATPPHPTRRNAAPCRAAISGLSRALKP